jgi:hypothetical protein
MGEGIRRAFAAAKATRRRSITYRLEQGGIVVASVTAATEAVARAEILHYAAVYGRDGPCTIVPPLRPAPVE